MAALAACLVLSGCVFFVEDDGDDVATAPGVTRVRSADLPAFVAGATEQDEPDAGLEVEPPPPSEGGGGSVTILDGGEPAGSGGDDDWGDGNGDGFDSSFGDRSPENQFTDELSSDADDRQLRAAIAASNDLVFLCTVYLNDPDLANRAAAYRQLQPMGEPEGVICPSGVRVGNDFWPSYEQSEADRALRDAISRTELTDAPTGAAFADRAAWLCGLALEGDPAVSAAAYRAARDVERPVPIQCGDRTLYVGADWWDDWLEATADRTIRDHLRASNDIELLCSVASADTNAANRAAAYWRLNELIDGPVNCGS
ncbi:MAG: hypothetical protein S0880_31340 [Actinomycetota bacterium]|nr:hypothetical protein [Actinomycetota bacterium]